MKMPAAIPMICATTIMTNPCGLGALRKIHTFRFAATRLHQYLHVVRVCGSTRYLPERPSILMGQQPTTDMWRTLPHWRGQSR